MGGGTTGAILLLSLWVFVLSQDKSFADTFLWNGNGVTGGTGDSILNTSGNWLPTGTPSTGDTAVISLDTSASLGQSAPLNIGTLTLTTLSGGTLHLGVNNEIGRLNVSSDSTLRLGGLTTVTTQYQQTGGVLVLDAGANLVLPSAAPTTIGLGATIVTGGSGVMTLTAGGGTFANSGVININTGGTLVFAPGSSISTGLIGLWNFEGNFADASGMGFSGAPVLGAGIGSNGSQKIGSGALTLTGGNQYVSVVSNPLLNSSTLAFAAWVFQPAIGATAAGNIVSKNGNTGYRWRLLSGGTVNTLDRGATNQLFSSTAATPGSWHFVVINWSPSGTEIYIDGTLNASNATAFGGGPMAGAAAFQIGADTTNSEYWRGLIDQLAVFNRALSPSEIAAYYNNGAGMELTQRAVANAAGLQFNEYINNPIGQILVSGASTLDAMNVFVTNYGTVSVTGNAAAYFRSLNNHGSLDVSGGSVSSIGITNSGTGVITINSGGISLSGGMVLNDNSRLVVNGGRLDAGTSGLYINSGASAQFNTLAGQTVRPVTNQGTLILSANGSFASVYYAVAGGHLQLSAGNVASSSTHITNFGTIVVGPGATLSSQTSFNNALGGVVRLNGGALLANASGGAARWTNMGEIRSEAPNSFLRWLWGDSRQAQNQGLIDFSAGGTILFHSTIAATTHFTNFSGATIIAGNGGFEYRADNTTNVFIFQNFGYLDSRLGTLRIGGAGRISNNGANADNVINAATGIILLGEPGLTFSGNSSGAGGQGRLFTNYGIISYQPLSFVTGSMTFEGNLVGGQQHNFLKNRGTIESIGGTFNLIRTQLSADILRNQSTSLTPANSAIELGGVYRAGSFTGGAGKNGILLIGGQFLGAGNSGSITSIAATGGIIIEGSLSSILLSNTGAVIVPLALHTIRTNRGILQFGAGQSVNFGATLTDVGSGALISSGGSVSATGLLHGASSQNTRLIAQNGGTLVLPVAYTGSGVTIRQEDPGSAIVLSGLGLLADNLSAWSTGTLQFSNSTANSGSFTVNLSALTSAGFTGGTIIAGGNADAGEHGVTVVLDNPAFTVNNGNLVAARAGTISVPHFAGNGPTGRVTVLPGGNATLGAAFTINTGILEAGGGQITTPQLMTNIGVMRATANNAGGTFALASDAFPAPRYLTNDALGSITVGGFDPGLVGLWRFNGDYTDASPNGFNGTPTGAPNLITSLPGQFKFGGAAASLEGNTATYFITPSSNNTSPFQISIGTVYAWIKTTDTDANYNAVLVKNEAFGLFVKNGRLIAYNWSGTGGSGDKDTGIFIADGNWHQVAMTFQPGINTSTIYIDGVAVLTLSSNVLNHSYGFLVGKQDGFNQAFSGQIDDAALFNRMLSASEIAFLYNNGIGRQLSPFTNSSLTMVGANLTNFGLVQVSSIGTLSIFEDLTATARGTVHNESGGTISFRESGALLAHVVNRAGGTISIAAGTQALLDGNLLNESVIALAPAANQQQLTVTGLLSNAGSIQLSPSSGGAATLSAGKLYLSPASGGFSATGTSAVVITGTDGGGIKAFDTSAYAPSDFAKFSMGSGTTLMFNSANTGVQSLVVTGTASGAANAQNFQLGNLNVGGVALVQLTTNGNLGATPAKLFAQNLFLTGGEFDANGISVSLAQRLHLAGGTLQPSASQPIATFDLGATGSFTMSGGYLQAGVTGANQFLNILTNQLTLTINGGTILVANNSSISLFPTSGTSAIFLNMTGGNIVADNAEFVIPNIGTTSINATIIATNGGQITIASPGASNNAQLIGNVIVPIIVNNGLIQSGATLSLGVLLANNPGATINSVGPGGNITIQTGFASNAGYLQVHGGNILGGLLTNAGTMQGAATNTGGAFIFANSPTGVLVNTNSGVIQIVANGATMDITGVNLSNAGIIRIGAVGDISLYSDLAKTIEGSISNIAGGRIFFTASGTLAAHVINELGGTFSINNGVRASIASDLTNLGVLALNPSGATFQSLQIAGALHNLGTVELHPTSGASVTLAVNRLVLDAGSSFSALANSAVVIRGRDAEVPAFDLSALGTADFARFNFANGATLVFAPTSGGSVPQLLVARGTTSGAANAENFFINNLEVSNNGFVQLTNAGNLADAKLWLGNLFLTGANSNFDSNTIPVEIAQLMLVGGGTLQPFGSGGSILSAHITVSAGGSLHVTGGWLQAGVTGANQHLDIGTSQTTLTLAGGTVQMANSSTTTLFLGRSTDVTGGNILANAATITIDNLTSLTGGGRILTANNGVVIVNNTANSFNLSVSNGTFSFPNLTANTASITAGVNGNVTLSHSFASNSGVLEAQGGKVFVTALQTNAGQIQVTAKNSGGTFVLADTTFPAGRFVTNDATGTIRLGTPQVVNTSRLVGLWQFDGDFINSAGTGLNNGTPVNGTTATMIFTGSPKLGTGAGSFNGINQYVDVNGNTVDFQITAGTALGWFKTTDADANANAILVKSRAYGLFVYQGKLQVYDWNAGAWRDTGVAVADGNWHFAALTFQPGTNQTTIYLDGASFTTTVNSNEPTSMPFAIGAQLDPGIVNQTFQGNLDEVALFKRVLSPAEIAQIYNGGAGIQITPLTNASLTMLGANLSNAGLVQINSLGTLAVYNDLAGASRGNLHNKHGGVISYTAAGTLLANVVNEGGATLSISKVSPAANLVGNVDNSGLLGVLNNSSSSATFNIIGNASNSTSGSIALITNTANTQALAFKAGAGGQGDLANAGSVLFQSVAGAKLNLTVDGALTNTGIIAASGAGVSEIKGGSGFRTNAGVISVNNGGTLVLSAALPASGIVALLNMDGNFNDSSAFGNHGVAATGGITFVSGKFGLAASFTNATGSAGDAVDIFDSPSLRSKSFAVEAWINPSNLSGVRGFVAKGSTSDTRWRMFFTSAGGGTMEFDVFPGEIANAQAPTTVNTGTWSHLVMSFDADDQAVTVFLNGVAGPVITGIGDMRGMDALTTRIGIYLGTGNRYAGLIDQYVMYNRALSAAEVLNHYNGGAGVLLSDSYVQNFLMTEQGIVPSHWTNDAGATITISGGGVLDMSSGSLSNQGALIFDGNGRALIGGHVANFGTILSTGSMGSASTLSVGSIYLHTGSSLSLFNLGTTTSTLVITGNDSNAPGSITFGGAMTTANAKDLVDLSTARLIFSGNSGQTATFSVWGTESGTATAAPWVAENGMIGHLVVSGSGLGEFVKLTTGSGLLPAEIPALYVGTLSFLGGPAILDLNGINLHILEVGYLPMGNIIVSGSAVVTMGTVGSSSGTIVINTGSFVGAGTNSTFDLSAFNVHQFGGLQMGGGTVNMSGTLFFGIDNVTAFDFGSGNYFNPTGQTMSGSGAVLVKSNGAAPIFSNAGIFRPSATLSVRNTDGTLAFMYNAGSINGAYSTGLFEVGSLTIDLTSNGGWVSGFRNQIDGFNEGGRFRLAGGAVTVDGNILFGTNNTADAGAGLAGYGTFTILGGTAEFRGNAIRADAAGQTLRVELPTTATNSGAIRIRAGAVLSVVGELINTGSISNDTAGSATFALDTPLLNQLGGRILATTANSGLSFSQLVTNANGGWVQLNASGASLQFGANLANHNGASIEFGVNGGRLIGNVVSQGLIQNIAQSSAGASIQGNLANEAGARFVIIQDSSAAIARSFTVTNGIVNDGEVQMRVIRQGSASSGDRGLTLTISGGAFANNADGSITIINTATAGTAFNSVVGNSLLGIRVTSGDFTNDGTLFITNINGGSGVAPHLVQTTVAANNITNNGLMTITNLGLGGYVQRAYTEFVANAQITNHGTIRGSMPTAAHVTAIVNFKGAGGARATFTNETTGYLEFTDAPFKADLTGVTLTNHGIIDIRSGAVVELGPVKKLGVVTVQDGVLLARSELTHQGTVNLLGGRMNLGDTWANNGYISMDSTSTLAASTPWVNNGIFDLSQGRFITAEFSNTGRIIKSSAGVTTIGLIERTGGLTDNRGTVEVSGGTLLVNWSDVALTNPLNPKGIWHLDGNFQDASGNANHGTGVGGATFDFSNPKVGTAAGSFNGNTAYVSVPHHSSLNMTNDFTLLTWFNIGREFADGVWANTGGNNDNNVMTIISKGRDLHEGSYRIGYDPYSHSVSFGITFSAASDPANTRFGRYVGAYTLEYPVLNQWHLAVGVLRDHGATRTMEFYMDGQLISSADMGTIVVGANTQALEIGKLNGYSFYTLGLIDEAAVLGRALTPQEIAAIYDNRRGVELSPTLSISPWIGSSITNQDNGRINVNSGGVIDFTLASLINSATINVESAGMAILGVVLGQSGTITLNNGILVSTSVWTNDGFVGGVDSELRMGAAQTFFNDGVVRFGGSLTGNLVNNADFAANGVATITNFFLNNATGVADTGLLGTIITESHATNFGIVKVQFGTFDAQAQGLRNEFNALTELTLGTLLGTVTTHGVISGYGYIPNLRTNTGTVEATGGTLDIEFSNVAGNGWFSIHSSGTLRFDGGSLDGTTHNDGGLVGRGTLTQLVVNTGKLSLFGSLTLLSTLDTSGEVYVGDHTLAVLQPWSNQGYVSMTSGSITGADFASGGVGGLVEGHGGFLANVTVQGGDVFTATGFGGNGTLVFHQLTNFTGGFVDTSSDGYVLNIGRFSGFGGVNISALPVINLGTVSTAAGEQFVFAGGPGQPAPIQVGTFETVGAGARIRVDRAWSNDGYVLIDGGTLHTVGIFTNNGLIRLGGNGTLFAGTHHNWGTLSLFGDGTLSGTMNNRNLTELNGNLLRAAVVQNSAPAGGAATLALGNGWASVTAITNFRDGMITMAGGSITMSGALQNLGTSAGQPLIRGNGWIQVGTGLGVLNRSGAQIEVTGGVMTVHATGASSLTNNGNIYIGSGATLRVNQAWVQRDFLTVGGTSFSYLPTVTLDNGVLAGATLTLVNTSTLHGVSGHGTISGAVAIGGNTITATGAGLNFTNATLATTLGGGTITGSVARNYGRIIGTGVIETVFENHLDALLRVAGGNMSLTSPTAPTNDGTILVGPHVLDVAAPVWTNDGYLHVQGGSVRTGNGMGHFINAFFVSTGSSIDSNFTNFGTFALTNHTSITGNFTNAGWTDFGGFNLTVLGSLNSNLGDGSLTGVLTGAGTYTIAPTSGQTTFTNTVTLAATLGGNYDTRSMSFAMANGTINFEVTSTDVGSATIPGLAALSEGFAMGTLTLPNTLTLLRLLDQTINQGGGTQEAIYVENLHLGSALTAANFDFGANNLKIYYNHIIGDGGVNFVGVYDGAARIVYFNNIIPLSDPVPGAVVPEPSTLALLLLGLPILWFVWKRRRSGAATNPS